MMGTYHFPKNAHVRVPIRGLEMLVFRKIWHKRLSNWWKCLISTNIHHFSEKKKLPKVNNKYNGSKALALLCYFWPIKCHCCPQIKTSQLIYTANQSTGFYMRATLALNGLNARQALYWRDSSFFMKRKVISLVKDDISVV